MYVGMYIIYSNTYRCQLDALTDVVFAQIHFVMDIALPPNRFATSTILVVARPTLPTKFTDQLDCLDRLY